MTPHKKMCCLAARTSINISVEIWNCITTFLKFSLTFTPVVFFPPEDLWLQYIQEELGALGQPENCGKIHWRAMKFLEGESVERFISRYTLLQTGHL